MYLNSRYSYMALIGSSAFVVCMTFLFHLSSAETLSHLALRSGNSLRQFPFAADAHASYRHLLANIRPSDAQPHSRTLGVASHIYVLSLPRRVDRRRSMDYLARALDLHFEYVDGVESTNSSIDHALDTLRRERNKFRRKYFQDGGGVMFPGFAFPSLKELQGETGNTTPNTWSNIAHLVSLSPLVTEASISNPLGVKDTRIYEKDPPLSCATPEDPFPSLPSETEISLLPPWRILSRGMVACWISHLKIIHKIAMLQDERAVAIVLEDDVDMEFDIAWRLRGLWPALPPNGWDIVMLGYCHSDEMAYPPLAGAASVRPSFAPKCTHAYALSRIGARRLYQILSTPGFAYSRALDQAISWLIKIKELRGYSIVPAIVVQNKRTRSDIWRTAGQDQNSSDRISEKGSKWRDTLVDSTLERMQMVANGLGWAEGA